MLLCTLLLGGCAVVDPHNLIGRHRTPPVVAETPVPVKDESYRQAALDFVWNTINTRYYDPTLNGVDWRAVRVKHEPCILAASNDDEFWDRLDKMTGELKDSHTRIHSPKQAAQQRNSESHSLGLNFIEMDDALMLTSVHPQSDAYWAGARAGMRIKTIDNQPALLHYRRLVDESRETSTPWARRRGAIRAINSGDIDTVVTMVFLRADGSEFQVRMKRRRFASPPEYMARVLPSGFAYLRFSAFDTRIQAAVLAEVEKMREAPGMIVDLRGNGGGSGEMSAKLAGRFFRDKQTGIRLLTRTGKPVSLFFMDVMKLEPELKGAGDKAYTKPVAIIVNESSASASEAFTVAMKELQRATVVGQRTCGCLLGYLGYADVPGGGWLAYSEIGFVTKNGTRVEGSGVLPDVEVKLTREDYLFNRDRMLEAAETVLREKTAASKDTALSQ